MFHNFWSLFSVLDSRNNKYFYRLMYEVIILTMNLIMIN